MLDLVQILSFILSAVFGGSVGGAGGFWIARKKAETEAKLSEAQIDKLKDEVTLTWIQGLQDRLKDLEESNDLKSQKIEQLEAIVRTRRLPNPNQSEG